LTSYIFQQIAQRGKAEGIDSSIRARDARTWFRTTAQQVQSVNRPRLMNDPENIVHQIDVNDIGKMFMFFYDPKMKEVLPYYDRFPLIFVIGFKENGFLGINMHYLPPLLRAKLMDAVYQTITNKKYDSTTKLKISYSVLNSASKYRYFKPCVKHYLWDHVQGNFLNVEPTNWDTALMLPTESFRKATRDRVWNDSKGAY
jgi:hypothetical protein